MSGEITHTVDYVGVINRRGFCIPGLEALWFAKWMTPMIGKNIRLRYDRRDLRTAKFFDIESGELIGTARLVMASGYVSRSYVATLRKHEASRRRQGRHTATLVFLEKEHA